MAKKPKHTILHVIFKRPILEAPKVWSLLCLESKKLYREITFPFIVWKYEERPEWSEDFQSLYIGSQFRKDLEYRCLGNGHCFYMFGTDIGKLLQAWESQLSPNTIYVSKNTKILQTLQQKIETGEIPVSQDIWR